MATPYFSEIRYIGRPADDFMKIAVDAGADVSALKVVVYDTDGTVKSISPLVRKLSSDSGKDFYIVEVTPIGSFTGLPVHGAIALVEEGTVHSFSSFDGTTTLTALDGDALGLTSTQIGQSGPEKTLLITDGGASQNLLSTAEQDAPCFVSGTMILTEAGEQAVESLGIGDRVLTRDHGLQPIRWIGHKYIPATDGASDHLRPICLKANCFGPGIPARNLLVSPNHRILIHDFFCSLLFETREVLACAKFLLESDGVIAADIGGGFAYYHILFDRHEIIHANGLETESFHPGQIGLEAFGAETCEEIFQMFPELRHTTSSFGKLARLDLRRFEARVLVDFMSGLRGAHPGLPSAKDDRTNKKARRAQVFDPINPGPNAPGGI